MAPTHKMQEKVAVIGAGIMGREIVLKLLEAGYEVSVYNRTAQKTDILVNAGAIRADTPAVAADNADYIISMVGDDDASRAVWLGENGLLRAASKSGAIAIECSTLSRGWILQLHDKLHSVGIRFADCPVTGGPDGARAGTLLILAGGATEVLAKIKPVLSAFSREVIHFGPVGAGTSYKLIVNLMGAAQATALAEGLVLAETAGLDLKQVGYALDKGSVASPHVQYLIERMVHGNHDDVYFSARWRHKDAAYALALAAECGLDMPVSEVATELFQRALQQGLGEKNSSIVIDVLRSET